MTVAHGVPHYENFPVASILCPARLRPAIAAIYWFARTADDIADEGDASAAQRLTDLAAFRADLLACAAETGGGQTVSTRWSCIFTALAVQIRAHDLPVSLLDDLLCAFEQDVRYTAAGRWYADHAELLDYCRRSANPIGRLLVHLYGLRESTALAQSDAVCSALQLINFWQDPSKDIPRQRFYFPRDAMASHGVLPEHLQALRDTQSTMKMIASCAYFAGSIMQKAVDLSGKISAAMRRNGFSRFDAFRASLELRCVIQGGLRILEKIRALDFQTLSQRPQLGKWDACVIFWRAFWMPG